MGSPFKKFRGVTDKQLVNTFEEHAKVINYIGRVAVITRRRSTLMLVLVLIDTLAIAALVLRYL